MGVIVEWLALDARLYIPYTVYYELYLYITLADTAVEIASSAQNNKAGLFRAKFGSAKLAQ